MNDDKLIINGCTYIKQTTEPVKRIRKRFYIDDNNSVMAFLNNDFGIVTGFCGYRSQAMNAAELFNGEIIISKEDFERLVKNAVRDFDKSLSVKQFMFLFIEELFK